MPQIIEVENIFDKKLDIFARLTETQLRNKLEPEKGIFIAESPKVIKLALEFGCRPIAFLMERKHILGDGSALLERCEDVPVYTADAAVLAQLTGYRLTRGVLCAMHRPALLTSEVVSKCAKRLAVLEGVVDSTNIGAIFRSAAAMGMDGILLSTTCCDPLCRRAVRVSMGTVFQIPWAWMDALGIATLKENGFTTVAMALDDRAIPISSELLKSQERIAVVLGSEGDGLSQDTLKACDYTAIIPMYHNVDSLNVAAASAVAFWELRENN